MRLIAMVVAALCLAAPAWAQPAAWPDGRQAAIVLTYDDALTSQLDNAIPQLDAAGLKGTFFLMGRSGGLDVDRWRAVAANGHELGNHSVNHPCARGSFEMPVPYHSENYTVETMLNEVGVMNRFLQAIDGRSAHSYATPCLQNLAGGEDYVGPLQDAGLATYVRDTRARLPENMPPMMGTGFAEVTGAQMIAWVEQVRAAGGLGVIVFHGIGGEHLAVSSEAHGELVRYLKAHENEIWTTTFSAAMDHATGAGARQ